MQGPASRSTYAFACSSPRAHYGRCPCWQSQAVTTHDSYRMLLIRDSTLSYVCPARSWLSAGGVGWPNWISHFGATAWALEFAPEALSKEPSVTPRSVDFVFRRWLCTCPAGPEKPPVASFRVGSRNKGVVFLRVTDSPGCPWPP